MEFEFSLVSFTKHSKGWQFLIGEQKRFDKAENWCIFRATKLKNKKLQIQICDRPKKSSH